jgi:hypothetical protein
MDGDMRWTNENEREEEEKIKSCNKIRMKSHKKATVDSIT